MSRETSEVVMEVSKWTVGLGMLVMVLFPFSLPFLILTGAALVPLVLPLVALALVAAVLAAPVLLGRRVVRRLTGNRSDAGVRSAERVEEPAASARGW